MNNKKERKKKTIEKNRGMKKIAATQCDVYTSLISDIELYSWRPIFFYGLAPFLCATESIYLSSWFRMYIDAAQAYKNVCVCEQKKRKAIVVSHSNCFWVYTKYTILSLFFSETNLFASILHLFHFD